VKKTDNRIGRKTGKPRRKMTETETTQLGTQTETESGDVEEGQESKRKMEELRVIDSREKFLYDRNGQTEADSKEDGEEDAWRGPSPREITP